MRCSALALVVVALSVGCVGTPDIPDAAALSCEGSGDCPGGYTCRESIGRCVPVGDLDTTPPRLEAASTVRPRAIRSGERALVSLAVSEVLLVAPVVELLDGAAVLVRLSAVPLDSLRYEVSLAPPPDTPDGTYSIVVDLIDAFGNEARESLGTLTVDVVGPPVSSLTLSVVGGAVAGPASSLQLAGAAESDATLDRATLRDQEGRSIADLSPFIRLSSGAATTLDATFELGGLALEGVAELVAEVSLRDPAGNVATSSSNSVAVDTVAPTTTVVKGPESLTAERVATLSLEADEVASFECSLDDRLYEPCAATYGPLTLGAHTLAVRAIDSAGNVEDPPLFLTWVIERRWAQLSAGERHSCAVATDGTLWCWGANGSGQLGDGTLGASAVPLQVGSRSDWAIAAAGTSHSCAIREDGTLWCWGSNAHGELGIGSQGDEEVRVPARVGSDRRFAEIALAKPGGLALSCAITGRGDTDPGELLCWGSRGNRGLGIDPLPPGDLLLPTPATTDSRYVALAHEGVGCAITTSGALECWGNNSSGVTGVGYRLAPDFYLAPTRVTAPKESGWSMVDVHVTHACGINDGRLYCWGSNPASDRPLGDSVPAGTTAYEPTLMDDGLDWVDVAVSGGASGEFSTCALRATGEVRCFGGNLRGNLGRGENGAADPNPASVAGLNDAVALDGGGAFFCAQSAAGEVSCWGGNRDGQLGNGRSAQPSGTPRQVGVRSDWVEVEVGPSNGCARAADGSVFCWGAHQDGQLGDEGVLPRERPVRVGGEVARWTTVAVGDVFACGLNGPAGSATLECWGKPQLESTLDPVVPPLQIGTRTDWQAVSAGVSYRCGVFADGAMFCEGAEGCGQLGKFPGNCSGCPGCWSDSTCDPGCTDTCSSCRGFGSSVETQVFHPSMTTAWASVHAGESHTCAVDENDHVYCWGYNFEGRLGGTSDDSLEHLPQQVRDFGQDQPLTVSLLDVSPGPALVLSRADAHSCAIGSGPYAGQLWCWGYGKDSQTGLALSATQTTEAKRVDPQKSDWVTVATGGAFTCAIDAAGELRCFGAGEFGELGDGNRFEEIPYSFSVPVSEPGPWSAVAASTNHACAIKQDGTLWCWGANEFGQRGDGGLFSSAPERVLRDPGF